MPQRFLNLFGDFSFVKNLMILFAAYISASLKWFQHIPDEVVKQVAGAIIAWGVIKLIEYTIKLYRTPEVKIKAKRKPKP
jgi:uncharacterized protein (DUF486 family)